jgi:hypothetical protein
MFSFSYMVPHAVALITSRNSFVCFSTPILIPNTTDPTTLFGFRRPHSYSILLRLTYRLYPSLRFFGRGSSVVEQWSAFGSAFEETSSAYFKVTTSSFLDSR